MELIGRRFGHIRVTGIAGEGGMGEVYTGFDELLERKVALKMLRADQRLDGSARERLLREARALSRLDHPYICRIHDYLESEDVDVLVLEYIDGRTITDLVGERIPKSDKLRIAIGVAEVLVTAHRAGIIHRDLKPENVMITREGDVKVLDFGLARWLKARTARSAERAQAIAAQPIATVVPLRTSATILMDQSAPGQTAAGVTLGTPLFMSPEQARGEALTPASDMFSFGLVLQMLFTGEEPHPEDLDGREVMARAGRGETNAVKKSAGDVRPLIQRLKQFAPADRPTAVETVEQLRRLAAKPQRIARRGVIGFFLLVLAFLGYRYMVDLQRERAAAQQAQAQAEDLMQFMLGDLTEKLRSDVAGLRVLDKVGNRALQYVQSRDPKEMSVGELTRNARALNHVGEVRIGLSKTAAALIALREAEKLTDEALRREPRNGEVLLVHGATQFWLGRSLARDPDRALVHMRKYIRAGEELVALDPSNVEYQLERAYAHAGAAEILEEQRNLGEALRHHRISLDVKAALAAREPGNVTTQETLARAYNKVGAVMFQLGNLRGAREMAEHELAISRSVVAQQPADWSAKERLTTSLAYTARAHAVTGNADAALALYSEELRGRRELARHDPDNRAWQRNAAVSMRRVADGLALRGESDAALALYRESLETLRAAIRAAPNARYDHDLTGTEIGLARTLTAMGRVAEGRQMVESAVRRLEAMAAGDRRTQYGLGWAYHAKGDLLRVRDPRAARAAWEQAEHALEPLMRDSNNPSELALWAEVLIRRGRGSEAQSVIGRLERTGYKTAELVSLCRETGC